MLSTAKGGQMHRKKMGLSVELTVLYDQNGSTKQFRF